MLKTITTTLFLWKNNELNYINNSLAEMLYTKRLAMGDDKNYTITIGSASEDIGGWQSAYSPSSIDCTVNLDTSYTTDTGSEFVYNMPGYSEKEFIDIMPSISRIDEMCKQYPALEKAYEQFKLIYKMTEQDYKGKLKERGIDDDIPF